MYEMELYTEYTVLQVFLCRKNKGFFFVYFFSFAQKSEIDFVGSLCTGFLRSSTALHSFIYFCVPRNLVGIYIETVFVNGLQN